MKKEVIQDINYVYERIQKAKCFPESAYYFGCEIDENTYPEILFKLLIIEHNNTKSLRQDISDIVSIRES